jgi:hypothetical protein
MNSTSPSTSTPLAHLVGITCNTPNARHVYHLADAFRRRGRLVVLGGPHAPAAHACSWGSSPSPDVISAGRHHDCWLIPHVN